MLPSWCTDSVTVTRAPLATSNGRTERDWSHAQTHNLTGCSVQQTSTATDFGAVDATHAISATLYAPPSSDIQAEDRIVHGSRTYVVNGAPATVNSPTGAVSHVMALLSAWGG